MLVTLCAAIGVLDSGIIEWTEGVVIFFLCSHEQVWVFACLRLMAVSSVLGIGVEWTCTRHCIYTVSV